MGVKVCLFVLELSGKKEEKEWVEVEEVKKGHAPDLSTKMKTCLLTSVLPSRCYRGEKTTFGKYFSVVVDTVKHLFAKM